MLLGDIHFWSLRVQKKNFKLTGVSAFHASSTRNGNVCSVFCLILWHTKLFGWEKVTRSSLFTLVSCKYSSSVSISCFFIAINFPNFFIMCFRACASLSRSFCERLSTSKTSITWSADALSSRKKWNFFFFSDKSWRDTEWGLVDGQTPLV